MWCWRDTQSNLDPGQKEETVRTGAGSSRMWSGPAEPTGLLNQLGFHSPSQVTARPLRVTGGSWWEGNSAWEGPGTVLADRTSALRSLRWSWGGASGWDWQRADGTGLWVWRQRRHSGKGGRKESLGTAAAVRKSPSVWEERMLSSKIWGPLILLFLLAKARLTPKAWVVELGCGRDQVMPTHRTCLTHSCMTTLISKTGQLLPNKKLRFPLSVFTPSSVSFLWWVLNLEQDRLCSSYHTFI